MTPEYLPKLHQAKEELRDEGGLHNWGLKPNPMLATFSVHEREYEQLLVNPRRMVLGHEFVLPQERKPYPQTRAEAANAPWPWQVNQVLQWFMVVAIPRGTDERDPQPWLAAAMTMPIDTDKQAMLFVEATRQITHAKTIPVMARWRMIVTDPTKRNAAAMVGSALSGQATSLWSIPEAQDIGQIIFLDGLLSKDRDVRTQMAYALRDLREGWTGTGGLTRRPLPANSVIALAERGIGMDDDAWTRLYCYAFTVCEVVDNPPFKPNRSMGSKSPEVAVQLDTFAAWYASQKERLSALAAEEAPAMERARSLLDSAARTIQPVR